MRRLNRLLPLRHHQAVHSINNRQSGTTCPSTLKCGENTTRDYVSNAALSTGGSCAFTWLSRALNAEDKNVPPPTLVLPNPETNRVGADTTAGAATIAKPVVANITPAVAPGFSRAELTIYDSIYPWSMIARTRSELTAPAAFGTCSVANIFA